MRESEGQVFYHFLLWEDWNMGMYNVRSSTPHIDAAGALLASPHLFGIAATLALETMPHAAAHNLTALHRNHRPWIGRAACLVDAAATMYETSAAWAQLTPQQQPLANTVADHKALHWRDANMKGQRRWKW